jgi:hypothetical protein
MAAGTRFTAGGNTAKQRRHRIQGWPLTVNKSLGQDMVDLEGCIAGVQEMVSRSKRLRDFVAGGGDPSDPAFRISALERNTLDLVCLTVLKEVLPPESAVIEKWVVSKPDVGGGIEEGIRTYEDKLSILKTILSVMPPRGTKSASPRDETD